MNLGSKNMPSAPTMTLFEGQRRFFHLLHMLPLLHFKVAHSVIDSGLLLSAPSADQQDFSKIERKHNSRAKYVLRTQKRAEEATRVAQRS